MAAATAVAILGFALAYPDSRAPVLLDLGVGSGELASCCLRVAPQARIIGIDSDEAILSLARPSDFPKYCHCSCGLDKGSGMSTALLSAL